MLKKFLLALGSCCLVVALTMAGYLVYLYTHREFKPHQFKHSIVQEMTMNLPMPDEETKDEIKQILSQKFTYLAFGKQMTAYGSADGRYVIKFFNPRPPLKEKWFHSFKKIKYFCTFKWLSRAYFKKDERLGKIFNRHVAAFNELKEETALVYVHLNRLTAVKIAAEVVDRDGTSYCINLEETPFVLQKKVELAADRLARLQNQNDQEGLREALCQIRDLFTSRARKGFTDRIQTLNNNYGFLDSKAVQIDFGRIWRDEQMNADEEVEKIMSNIRASWPLFQDCSASKQL